MDKRTNPETRKELQDTFPVTPETFVCAPEDGAKVEELQDEFFSSIVNLLGYTTPESREWCNIRSRELIRENETPVETNATNDRVTELQIRERTIATVTTIRTDLNFVQVLFASHLDPELKQQLQFRTPQS